MREKDRKPCIFPVFIPLGRMLNAHVIPSRQIQGCPKLTYETIAYFFYPSVAKISNTRENGIFKCLEGERGILLLDAIRFYSMTFIFISVFYVCVCVCIFSFDSSLSTCIEKLKKNSSSI